VLIYLGKFTTNPLMKLEYNWKKNITLFLVGQAFSIFGSLLVQYAIVWYITLKTGSGSMMTVFILAGVLPTFFISPFAGVWADRFNRKYLINGADASIAVTTLIVALFFIAGFENTWLLLICAALRALGQGVQLPAVNALIPQIIPPEYLTRINGINSSIQSTAMLTAPMVSGALLQFASINIIFFLDVITAAIGIGIVFCCVKIPAVSREATSGGQHPEAQTGEQQAQGIDYFRDLREGVRYIKSHKYILRLIVISILFFIAVSPTAFLTTLQVTRNFGPDIWRLTAIEMAFSSGMMLGGMIIGFWGGFKNRVHTMALACAFFGVEAIGLGLLSNFWLYVAVMGIMGVTMPIYNTPSMVMIQSRVDSAYMGRVSSVFSMISSLMMPAGMVIFGPLADLISIDIILIITGTLISFLALPFMFSRSLRAAGLPC
jgi:DHA3 family macrolide efflux protein-like MFS transporter